MIAKEKDTISRSRNSCKFVANVCSIIDRQSSTEDGQNRRGDFDSEAQPVQRTHQIDDRENNTQIHYHGSFEIADEKKSHSADSTKSDR